MTSEHVVSNHCTGNVIYKHVSEYWNIIRRPSWRSCAKLKWTLDAFKVTLREVLSNEITLIYAMLTQLSLTYVCPGCSSNNEFRILADFLH